MIGHLVARFSGRASLIGRQHIEERDLVDRPRIHVEEERIQPLMPTRRRAVEQARLHGDGDRHDPVCQLSKQRREPEEVRLPARGPLGAHYEAFPLV